LPQFGIALLIVEVCGRNDAAIERQPASIGQVLKSNVAARLMETGEEIARMRERLGYTEAFDLYDRYLQYRQMQFSNSPGEPKLALQFLQELGER